MTTVKAKVDSKPTNQENAAPNRNTVAVAGGAVDKDKEIASLRSALEDSRKAFQEMKIEMDGIDKEREFYFDKLRDIEVMLQDIEEKGHGNELTAAIFKILYATADGFEPTDAEPSAANFNVANDSAGIAVEVDAAEETY